MSNPPSQARPRRRGAWPWALSLAYAVAVLVVLALLTFGAERWWPATLLLFGPRWLVLAPLGVLLPLAMVRRHGRALGVQLAAALVAIGPVMGFCVPIARLRPAPSGERLRVMTFNRGADHPIDARGLVRLIEAERIDLICFQEGVVEPELDAYFTRHGWHRDARRVIASRLPIEREFPFEEGPWFEVGAWSVRVHRVVVRSASGRRFLLADVHMPTMSWAVRKFREGDRAAFDRFSDWRRQQLAVLLDKLAEAPGVPVLVGGDFNMPSDSPILASLGPRFRFAFEEAGLGLGYTRPSGLPWVRIDHLLGGPGWHFRRCWVGPDLGSDHLPLIAEAVLEPGP